MGTKTIDKKFLKAFAAEAEEALQKLAEKYEIDVKHGGGTFTPGVATLKFDFCVRGEDGVTVTKEAETFTACADLFGFKPDDLGREFRNGNSTYRISGLKPRSPKYPILAQDVKTGKQYKFPAEYVKTRLA